MNDYSKEDLVAFYQKMLTIRMCEERFVDPILHGEIRCPVHLCSGQEAVAVGACSALEQGDYIFGGHRSHGHYLAKGGDLNRLVAEIFGKETGCSKGRGGSMHLIDPDNGVLGVAPIVAGTISLGVGAALFSKLMKKDKICISFFGDGATGEGVLYESMNFAKIHHLPIIFLCENNLYSTHMPIKRIRPNKEIFRVGEPFDIDTLDVDGNDVIAVYEAVKEAAGKCRKGRGPVFLECKTYRLRGHVGPDDNIQGTHTDIRPHDEINIWRKKDPIVIFRESQIRQGTLERKDIEDIKLKVAGFIDSAFQFAMDSQYPKPQEVTNYVFK